MLLKNLLKYFLMSTLLLLIAAPLYAEDKFNPYSKDYGCLIVSTTMKINFETEGIEFKEVLCRIEKKENPVSHIVIHVYTKYLNDGPLNVRTIRINSLAIQAVADLTQSSKWSSKYFELNVHNLLNRNTAFLYLTIECRRFRKLQKTSRSRTQLGLELLQVMADSFDRAKKNPDWLHE